MLGIHGTKVKVGFEVNPDVLVHRSEVWERLRDGGQRKRPQSSPPAMNQELGRWEDDGGGPTAATTSEGSSEPSSDRESHSRYSLEHLKQFTIFVVSPRFDIWENNDELILTQRDGKTWLVKDGNSENHLLPSIFYLRRRLVSFSLAPTPPAFGRTALAGIDLRKLGKPGRFPTESPRLPIPHPNHARRGRRVCSPAPPSATAYRGTASGLPPNASAPRSAHSLCPCSAGPETPDRLRASRNPKSDVRNGGNERE